MIAAIVSALRRLFCKHRYQHERFVAAPSGILIRERCRFCGSFRLTAQPVAERERA